MCIRDRYQRRVHGVGIQERKLLWMKIISNNSNINIKLDAGENKIKYYENNDVNCIFEILETDKEENQIDSVENSNTCLLYTSPSPRDLSTSRMPSSA
eukprot:TRINITY_DN6556_c0_g1_i10.p2 TRINITY_DN6556_c0_g1~~TRINITY_DN6556_c0_g1_i10.p2  ORF type:complete len:108 (+),score=32.06 TRINITY_DN6556_c0_g1_i10:31-324(+)